MGLDVRRSSTSSTIHTPGIFSGGLNIRHGHFIDQHGRVQILRGVNLGGTSKLPTGYAHVDPLSCDGKTSSFFDNAPFVSFINRPFPLIEADRHFSRLRRWGLTFLRLIITWEAIEHRGPGIYDYEYLEYIRALLEKANEYGLKVYIDPHQDVWSRWTGGDGAPLWTLEIIGLEPRHFETTKTAFCMETYQGTAANFPKMIWPTNYFKYACATMFTLFWSGNHYAPSCMIDDMPVQEYLQSHYINAMTELAQTLVGLQNIVGFGTMNEPSAGYIGVEDLNRCFHKGELKYELSPTPFQGMCLSEGIPQLVGSWSNGLTQHVLGRPDKYITIDPEGIRAWKEGKNCVWQNEGVWSLDALTGQPVLHKPHYFANIDFGQVFYLPFAKRYAERIRSVLAHTMLFVELPPLEFSSGEFPFISDKIIPRAINATHWYDGVTLFLRSWCPYFTVDPRTKIPAFGYHAVRKLHRRQLADIKEYGCKKMNNAPTLIGETGIPFNLNNGRAYKTGNYSAPIEALDHTISCIEANLLSFTLWCYSAENTHQYGDHWNLEDLSIVCDANMESIHENTPFLSTKDALNQPLVSNTMNIDVDDTSARALIAFARPYATKIAGIPSRSSYQLNKRQYILEYQSDVAKVSEHIIEPTELHIPLCQYPMGYTILLSNGKYEIQNHIGYDTILYYHDEKIQFHRVEILTKDPRIERERRKQQWFERMLALMILLLLLLTIRLIL